MDRLFPKKQQTTTTQESYDLSDALGMTETAGTTPKEKVEYLEIEQESRVFEHLLYFTGSAYAIAATVGGLYGAYVGIATAKKKTWSVIRNNLLSKVGSTAIKTANQAGAIAFMYHMGTLGVNYQLEKEDSLEAMYIAAMATGFVYNLRHRMRRRLMGAGIGFVCATAAGLYTRKIDYFAIQRAIAPFSDKLATKEEIEYRKEAPIIDANITTSTTTTSAKQEERL